MSLRSGQHQGELHEPIPLSDILRSTSFVSTSGRVYHLFGDEENTFVIPPCPSVLAAPKPSALSLEEALQQIESFSSRTTPCVSQPEQATGDPLVQTLPATASMPVESSTEIANQLQHAKPVKFVRTIERVCPNTDSPMLQLFQALKDPSVPRLVKRENPRLSPKPTGEKTQSLRIVAAPVAEPFIVPFAKPEAPPEETNTVTLKIVPATLPPILSPKMVRKYRQEKTPYRKRFSLPAAPPHATEDDRADAGSNDSLADSPAPTFAAQWVNYRSFRWSEPLDTLRQTAANQIRCLTDHLVVQANQGTKAICFKSVFPGDGCSTILLCAVRALMERHYRILLIDAHHQHIDLPKQLNVSEDVEAGGGGEVSCLDDHLDLWVWQESKTAAENRAILAKTLAVHRGEYDLILFDNGSVTESPLTELIEFWDQMELDGIVLIANTKRPTEMPVAHITRRLRQHHLHLIGITENYV